LNILRINGEGEFNSKEFNEYYVTMGIKHETTTPYSSQHNCLGERRNRTLLHMTISMLKGKGLPHYFWCEAMTTAKCPTKGLKFVTLEEALCYRHIPYEKRRKFDDKS